MFGFENGRRTPGERRGGRQEEACVDAIAPSKDCLSTTPPSKRCSMDDDRESPSSRLRITGTTKGSEWFNPAPPSPFERHEAELRHRVAHHLRQANTQHLVTATEKARAGEKTLAAHGVTLFYAGLDPLDPLDFRIYGLSRWVYSTPENDDLSRMLQRLDEAARGFMAAAAAENRQWDPRGPDRPLVNIGDFPAHPASAHYVGVGVQTLDTDRGRWADIVDSLTRMDPAAATRSLREVPCEAAGILVDGSVLRAVNGYEEPIGNDGVRKPRTLLAVQGPDPAQPPHDDFGETLTRAWPYFRVLSRTLQICSANGRHQSFRR